MLKAAHRDSVLQKHKQSKRTQIERRAVISAVKMAELQRQSSRRSTVDSEGEEVIVPGCFTKSVMRCPCAIMWGTFAVLQLPLHLRTRSHPTLTLNPHPHLPLAPTPPSTFTSTPREFRVYSSLTRQTEKR